MVQWNVGVMLWRIGDLLALDAQIDWLLDNQFDAVAFHAAAGNPPEWVGVDPATADAAARKRLRQRLDPFRGREVHAPFRLTVTAEDGLQIVDELAPVLQFSAEVGAEVVTVHAVTPGGSFEQHMIDQGRLDPSVRQPPQVQRDEQYLTALMALNAHARELGIVAALELHDGFDYVNRIGHSHLAINLDVGHMFHGRWHEPFGGFQQLVKHIGPNLTHCHIHDTTSAVDHLEIGTGIVDFEMVMQSFAAVNYPGFFIIEPNPNRVTPEGIVRGRDVLRQKMHTVKP